MEKTNYSVLMSVYYKEKPEYLRESMASIYDQTVSTNDFVLVCDGPLSDALEEVIVEMQELFEKHLHVVRLEKNSGLGNALNYGLDFCKNELVARMDSDDIAFMDRCENQLKCFESMSNLAIASGTILEFENSIEEITGKRQVPLSHTEICKFSRKRNPFNHPAVMFKKSEVKEAGGYSEEYPLFEDYYLWVRMLRNGSKGLNLATPVLYMRTPADMYMRRGGVAYAKKMLGFHQWLKSIHWSSLGDFLCGVVPHAIVCVMPNFLRKQIYKCIH